jgi:hypothetical protein
MSSTATRPLSWDDICRLEPRLLDLEHLAGAVTNWSEWSVSIKRPLTKLVGWDAETSHRELHTQEAYDLAFKHLLDQWGG